MPKLGDVIDYFCNNGEVIKTTVIATAPKRRGYLVLFPKDINPWLFGSFKFSLWEQVLPGVEINVNQAMADRYAFWYGNPAYL